MANICENHESSNDMLTSASNCQGLSDIGSTSENINNSHVKFTLAGRFKKVSYTVTVNERNQLQVTWRVKFLGFISFSKTVSATTSSSCYKTSQRLLTTVTGSCHLTQSVHFKAMQDYLKNKGGNETFLTLFLNNQSASRNNRLTPVQVCHLLRIAQHSDMLSMIDSIKHVPYFRTHILPSLAQNLRTLQFNELISHMLSNQVSQQVAKNVIELISHLPDDRLGDLRIMPFSLCQSFAAHLSDDDFQQLCLCLDYQQSITLLQATTEKASLLDEGRDTLKQNRYKVLAKEARITTVNIDGDKEFVLADFPSKNYKSPSKMSSTTEPYPLQIILSQLERQFESNFETAIEKLNTYPSTEMALMLVRFTGYDYFIRILNNIPAEKLAMMLQVQSIQSTYSIMLTLSQSSPQDAADLAKVNSKFRYMLANIDGVMYHEQRVIQGEVQEFAKRLAES